MKRLVLLLPLLLFLLFFSTLEAMAIPTTLVVRAKAKDAKFIGSSIGGARIIVREALSDKILAEGFTTGSTGNTQRIMQSPHERHQRLSTEETAAFNAIIDIEKPTLVTVEGYGPWQQAQARIKVTSQVWLIPGKNISGDGLILEFPGFVVNVLSPQTHESLNSGDTIPITANIVLMCGCPITEGGLWDANQYEVQALVEKDGQPGPKVPLMISQKANTFSGSLQADEPGLYQVSVYAYDAQTGNTGVATTNFLVKE